MKTTPALKDYAKPDIGSPTKPKNDSLVQQQLEKMMFNHQTLEHHRQKELASIRWNKPSTTAVVCHLKLQLLKICCTPPVPSYMLPWLQLLWSSRFASLLH